MNLNWSKVGFWFGFLAIIVGIFITCYFSWQYKLIRFLKKCFNKLIRFVDCFLVIMFLLNILIIPINIFIPRKIPPPTRESLLDRYTTDTIITSEDGDAQLVSLSDRVKQEINSYNQVLITRRSERMQTRLSFIALLAIILIPLLSNKGRIKHLGIVVSIAFLFFLSFYFFDIHTVDINSRQAYIMRCYGETASELSEISTSDANKYYINYETLNCLTKRAKKGHTIRKLKNYVRPDLSQISFYLIPITIILGIYFYSYNKQKEDSINTTT